MAALCMVAPAADVVVNEFMAQNAATITNSLGDTADWIELYNQGSSPVDLGGWYLSEDAGNPDKCALPSISLGVGQYLIVWADGSHTGIVNGEVFVDCKLSDDEPVLLVEPDGATVHHGLPATNHTDDVSFGILSDRASVDYLAEPTPGAANAMAEADAPAFSHPSGAYTNGFSLALTHGSPGAEIRYTLDRSLPTAASPLYAAPIPIAATNTTMVRARAFETGKADSPVAMQAYLMLDPTLRDFNSDMPIVLLETFGYDHEVTPRDPNTWRETFMIVINTNATGRAHITDAPDFAGRVGAHARGASSLNAAKVNLRLETRDEEGFDEDAAFLHFPPHADWILYGPYRNWGPDNLLLGRKAYAHRLYFATGRYGIRDTHVELLMNADGDAFELESGFADRDYHGVYLFMESISRGDERIDVTRLDPEDLAEPDITGGYILGWESEWDVIAGGTDWRYRYPRSEAMKTTHTAQANWLVDWIDECYAAVSGASTSKAYRDYIDVESWINFNVVAQFSQCHDAFTKSTYFFKERGGKLQMGPLFDYDAAWDAYSTDSWRAGTHGSEGGPRRAFNEQWWYHMFDDPDFWQAWIDRYHELRQGPMSVTNMVGILDDMSNEVWEAHFRNAERWPGSRYPDWQDWLVDRAAWCDSQFLPAPAFSQNGGLIVEGAVVTITAPAGTIYYTTDGTDPREPGGGIAAAAHGGPSPQSLSLAANTLVRARVYNAGWTITYEGGSGTIVDSIPWGAPTEAVFVVTVPQVSISEVMYAPRAATPTEAGTNGYTATDFEFIEIRNDANDTGSLLGLQLTDGVAFDFTYGDVTTLEPGEHVVVVNNLVAFKRRYAGWAAMKIAGEYSGNLANGGERIVLQGPLPGLEQENFGYDDTRGWPPAADGAGHSLVPSR